MKNIDINNIVVSNVSFGKKGFKYFIDYKDAKSTLLCMFLQKMSVYRRDFDETMKLNITLFLIKDNELLEKYNEIWGKSAIVSIKNLIVNLYTTKNI